MKDDFLKECLSDVSTQAKQSIPIDEFQKEFCVVCQNQECSRSGASNLTFVKRAANWNELLFEKVPRASDDDPKYESIRSKKFLPVNKAPEIKTVSTQPFISPEPVQKPTKEAPVVATPDPKPQEAPPGLGNTSFSQPMYVGAPQVSEAKEDDTKDVVISPGGSFTFGDELCLISLRNLNRLPLFSSRMLR